MADDLPDFPKNKGYPFRQMYSPGEAPPMSTAMQCSVALIVLFYSIDMGGVIYKFCFFDEDNDVQKDSTSFKDVPDERLSINGPTSDDDEEDSLAMKEEKEKLNRKNNNIFDRLAPIASTIPMLLLLFLIARLHGSVDLERTEPDEYMKQRGFIFATVCLFLEAFFAIIQGRFSGTMGKLLLICRIVAKVLYYVANVIIIVKFFEMVKY